MIWTKGGIEKSEKLEKLENPFFKTFKVYVVVPVGYPLLNSSTAYRIAVICLTYF